jgi:hypothetical protein
MAHCLPGPRGLKVVGVGSRQPREARAERDLVSRLRCAGRGPPPRPPEAGDQHGRRQPLAAKGLSGRDDAENVDLWPLGDRRDVDERGFLQGGDTPCELLPVFGPPGAGIFRGDSSGQRGRRRADYEGYRWLIADRAVRSDLVVVDASGKAHGFPTGDAQAYSQ